MPNNTSFVWAKHFVAEQHLTRPSHFPLNSVPSCRTFLLEGGFDQLQMQATAHSLLTSSGGAGCARRHRIAVSEPRVLPPPQPSCLRAAAARLPRQLAASQTFHRAPQTDVSVTRRRQCMEIRATSASAPPASSKVAKTVNVPLGDRSYPIYIGRGLLDQGELLRQHVPGSTALIVTNETIAPLYLERCVSQWPP